MGVSPAKLLNIYIDTVFNGPQYNNFNKFPTNLSSNKNSNETLRIFHQNMRGLHRKVDELTTRWLNFSPNILCFTEHHSKDHKIGNICINYYNLGAFIVGNAKNMEGYVYLCMTH